MILNQRKTQDDQDSYMTYFHNWMALHPDLLSIILNILYNKSNISYNQWIRCPGAYHVFFQQLYQGCPSTCVLIPRIIEKDALVHNLEKDALVLVFLYQG